MHSIIAAALMFLLLLPLNSPLQTQQSGIAHMMEKSVEQEVLDVIKRWNDCFERNDSAAYFSYIHDDLTLFIPSSPYRIDGKLVDKQEFEWSLSKSRTKVHLFQELQPVVQVFGNTAIVTYHNRGAYGPDGAEQMLSAKETNVLVKENGEWKIVHIHVSK